MSIQLRKTYRKLNPDLLYDEIRGLLSRHGLSTREDRMQTYSIASGETQSRVTAPVQDGSGKQCGTLHILGSSGTDVRMTITLDEDNVSQDTVSALQGDVDFILGSHEVNW